MVRVLIDRRVSEGMLETYQLALQDMRLQAVQREGYISGETLQDTANAHRFIVISTWNSIQDWKNWFASEPRQLVMVKIGPMLEEPELVTVLKPV